MRGARADRSGRRRALRWSGATALVVALTLGAVSSGLAADEIRGGTTGRYSTAATPSDAGIGRPVVHPRATGPLVLDTLVVAERRLFRECRWVLAAGRVLTTSEDGELRRRGRAIMRGVDPRLAARARLLAVPEPTRWVPPLWRSRRGPSPGPDADRAAVTAIVEHTRLADLAALALGFDLDGSGPPVC